MSRFPHDKIVIVTRSTLLDELVQRFGTRDQARFYIQSMGASFDGYQQAHDAYQNSRAALKDRLPPGVRVQWVDRAFLPNFTFGPGDLVITLGPDGLVVNTAKYLDGQPVLAFNPDPARIDGVLLPFQVPWASFAFDLIGRGAIGTRNVTMAEARLNDGQALLALNDLFIGARTHVSARYRLAIGGLAEDQSSSGIIVSTGAGSTGWFRSILTGAAAVAHAYVRTDRARKFRDEYAFDWESRRLAFSVREPFISRTSSADLVFGWIEPGQSLEVTSSMPRNGVIFSDGVEEDFLQFNSGSIARIGVASRSLRLLVPPGRLRPTVAKQSQKGQ